MLSNVIQKSNTWYVNNSKKTEILSLGLAHIRSEALNTKNLASSIKGNLFYSIDQKFPIGFVESPNISLLKDNFLPQPN